MPADDFEEQMGRILDVTCRAEFGCRTISAENVFRTCFGQTFLMERTWWNHNGAPKHRQTVGKKKSHKMMLITIIRRKNPVTRSGCLFSLPFCHRVTGINSKRISILYRMTTHLSNGPRSDAVPWKSPACTVMKEWKMTLTFTHIEK